MKLRWTLVCRFDTDVGAAKRGTNEAMAPKIDHLQKMRGAS
jgi:hypothetical protein